MEYYERIKAMREDHDKTQTEIAKILQTDQSYYAKWESGKHPMKAEHIKTLAIYYNISADYLLGIIDEPRPIKEIKK